MVGRLEFDAVVEAGSGGGALVVLPASAADVFGTAARVAVNVTFDGVPYRGSTMPMGDGTSCVGISKAIRAETGADVGRTVHVVVERDTAERTVAVPDDLAAALAGAGATAAFDALSYTRRKEHAGAVTSARRPETRQRRIEAIVREVSAT